MSRPVISQTAVTFTFVPFAIALSCGVPRPIEVSCSQVRKKYGKAGLKRNAS